MIKIVLKKIILILVTSIFIILILAKTQNGAKEFLKPGITNKAIENTIKNLGKGVASNTRNIKNNQEDEEEKHTKEKAKAKNELLNQMKN